MDKKLKVEKKDLQVLFDALVHSMDFGSGFLDDEEVEALRNVAGVLGVDPAVATPEDFLHQFPHVFQPGAVKWDLEKSDYVTHRLHCRIRGCFKRASEPIHIAPTATVADGAQ